MPLPAWITPALTAATGLGNIVSSSQLNAKNRRFQLQMWNRANEYNLPKNQMERFADAGLNPHLIYGQGNAGNTSYINPHEQRQPDLSPFADATMNYVSYRKQQTETDNMETARKLMEADIIKRNADTMNVLASTDKTKLDTNLLRSQFDTLVEQSKANLESTLTSTKKTTQEIENLLASKNLTEAQTTNIIQSTNESIQRVKNLVTDGKIKEADLVFKEVVAKYAKNGINFHSGYKDQFFKALANMIGLEEDGINSDKLLDNLKRGVKTTVKLNTNWQTFLLNKMIQLYGKFKR